MDLKIRKYFELKKNKRAFQNQWDASEEVLRWIFITSNVDTGKEERSQISNLIFNAREKKTRKRTKGTQNKQKEGNKDESREINETENRKSREQNQ